MDSERSPAVQAVAWAEGCIAITPIGKQHMVVVPREARVRPLTCRHVYGLPIHHRELVRGDAISLACVAYTASFRARELWTAFVPRRTLATRSRCVLHRPTPPRERRGGTCPPARPGGSFF